MMTRDEDPLPASPFTADEEAEAEAAAIAKGAF
jgi:hypothetical protein